jgi:hypothetical protein
MANRSKLLYVICILIVCSLPLWGQLQASVQPVPSPVVI